MTPAPDTSSKNAINDKTSTLANEMLKLLVNICGQKHSITKQDVSPRAGNPKVPCNPLAQAYILANISNPQDFEVNEVAHLRGESG